MRGVMGLCFKILNTEQVLKCLFARPQKICFPGFLRNSTFPWENPFSYSQF